jgi:hypothetical protein
MLDEAMHRLLGWSIRFRVAVVLATVSRPHGIKYAFTLHDVDRTRLLGFDNAHGLPRSQTFDHEHRFGRVTDAVAYDFTGADALICDFFAAVERACRQADVPFTFVAEDTEEGEDGDETG